MTQPAATPSRTGANRPLPYLHGSGTREQHRLGRRTAATAAAFFLPHLRPGMRLLDCGCGVGSITIGLAAAVAPGEAIGIDFQSEQIERARAVAYEAGVANVGFAVGSVYALPCPDASYDAAFAHTLLLHLREPPRALRELRRVLKPGGVVGIADDDRGTFLMEPATPLLEALHRLMQRAIQHHGGNPFIGRHERRLLLEAGFACPIAAPTFAPNGAQGTPEETREFAAWWVNQIRRPSFVALVTAQGWADEATLAAMAEEVIAWGELPDAYAAAMGVAAVGWNGEAG